MSNVLFALSLVLGFATFIGLIAPKKVLRGNPNPTRGKVLFFVGLPTIVFFVAFGMIHETSWDLALKNPSEATEVSLRYKKLETLPAELAQMTALVKLDAGKNNLMSLPEYLKNFDKLEELDLSENPIEVVPGWIAEMKSLKKLILDETKITRLPALAEIAISYEGTPLFIAENSRRMEEETVSEDTEEVDEREESLGEYALRQFLGKDYGYRRKFQKGEIYYNDPVTKDQVDIIGEFMIEMEFFNNEREASMLLDKIEEAYELKIVVVSEEALTYDVMQGFTYIESVIQRDVFGEDEFHLLLTDGTFDTIKTIE